jgi:alkanesulfonate monooxygenase SsuD/methylene tetrahydromethanopterin reductase-like flavin-dependent oxidoreductase (luciferase family)
VAGADLARLDDEQRRRRMITKFGSLYAGHVDFDDLGFDATPANDRWLSDERLAGVFDKALAIAEVMDRNGYDTFWMAEHHFQREGYEVLPNILMLAVHLAHLTKNIKIGCGFNIAPMWHPLRMAEDYATADILTNGRVVFGVGRGYHTREVEVFGAPMLDQDANRDLFEEQVDIIFKAFNERSFSHQGKHYTIPPRVPYRGYELTDLSLVPRPRTLPVECWQPVVSASQRGLDFMARHGIKGIIGGGAASGGANERVVEAWRDTLRRHGRDAELGTDLGIGFSFHIADTEEQAIKEATPFFEENMKMFAPLGFVRGLSEEQIRALAAGGATARQANLPTLRDAVKAGAWLCGPPELIVEKLLEVQAKYPALEVVNVGQVVGTPQRVIVEQLERFGKEVMPAFARQSSTAATVA